jgi:glycosyltransferase involved in cell wall biosynthesis
MNMDSMKISVIIPTYNRSHILPMALMSLLTQNYNFNDFEIIVIDNNSTDDTKQVIEQFIQENPQISVCHIFESRPGSGYARNTGAMNAKFDILTFSDDDVIFSPQCLGEISHIFEINKQICAVAGKIIIQWDERPPEWILPYEPLLGKQDYGDVIRFDKRLYLNSGNLSIRRDLFIKLGGFDIEQIGEWLVGDGDMGLSNKIHQEDCLIGWAPAAIVEHYQIVKKNATIKDMKRRYQNNGIATPYRIYAIQKKGMFGLLRNLFFVHVMICFEAIKYFLKLLQNDKKEKLNAIFMLSFYSAQIPYTIKILTDKKFRISLLHHDLLN